MPVMKREYPKTIGSIITNEEGYILNVEKGPTFQGACFKDWDAFYNHLNRPCYVAEYDEVGDKAWTRQAFLDLAEGSEEVAEYLFENVDWQSPSSLFLEDVKSEIIIRCDRCNSLYVPDEKEMPGTNLFQFTPCPVCGKIKE